MKFSQHVFVPLAFLAGVGLGIGVFYATVLYKPATSQPAPVAIEDTTPTTAGGAVSTTPVTTPTPTGEAFGEYVMPADMTSSTLDIAWSVSAKRDVATVLGSLLPDVLAGGAAKADALLWMTSSTRLFERGMIASDGPYKGYKLYYWMRPQSCDPGGCENLEKLLVSPDGKRVINLFAMASLHANTTVQGLPLYTDPEAHFEWDLSIMTPAPYLVISSAPKLPPQIKLEQGGSLYLTSVSYDLSESCGGDHCEGARKKLVADGFSFFDPLQPASGAWSNKRDMQGCYTVFGLDGRSYVYSPVLPGTQQSNDISGQYYDTAVSVIWNIGYTGDRSYVPYTLGGCGAHNCADIVSDSDMGPMTDYIAVGHAPNGDAFYAPKSPLTNTSYKAAYENFMTYDQEKPSIAVYARKHPNLVLFWKNPLNQWIRYTRSDAQPQAECGKPVIYLYPDSTTSVSVKLPSFVRVTKSVPAYPEGGWVVKADHSGKLTMKDGSVVDSLYWEGVGVNYSSPKEGFIVKDGNVDSFLVTALARLGLNTKESADFRAFWVPRMTGARYYRVSFLTSDWSKAAPLTVLPPPTTSIRLFMDWNKLSEPISIPGQVLSSIPRKGFTLVEWGGTLYQ